jgi:hypothetical protein
MNKTLFGLALLSHNWNNHKKDIFDSYVPLVCQTIIDKSHNLTSREHTQDDLLENYGINISLGACESLLKRMVKNGILTKNTTNEYIIHSSPLNEAVKHSQRDDLNRGFRVLVIEIKKYSKEVFTIDLSSEEIELGLINFFRDNDLDLLFANNDGKSVLPNVKESRKAKYIIAKYITDSKDSNPERFQVILKLAQGYAIASLITYQDIQSYSGNLADVEIFLDAPIIFSLLALNGESNLMLARELIEVLNINRAKLRVFEINYGEVIKTIQDSIRRLNENDYVLAKSSRVLRTAVRENISSQQLQIKLNQLEEILTKYKIEKQDIPPIVEWKYQIDQNKLSKTIEELYQGNKDTDYIPWWKSNQIERDVDAISGIFRIRKAQQAISLKNSKAIFLTNNDLIAFATRKYEQAEWPYKSTIPACVTDIFLSTILWANYPTKNDALNITQLMSECYNIIELDNRLLNRFYDDITKMHKDNIITNEQFYLLNSSNIAYSLLEKKTLNDIEVYTDKTPREILEDIEYQRNGELEAERNKLKRIDDKFIKYSKFIGTSVFYLLAGLIIVIYLIAKTFSPDIETTLLNNTIFVISLLIGAFGFMRWMEWIPTKTIIESKAQNWAYNKIKNIFT